METVTLTHLDTDHRLGVDNGVGKPYFRNARHLVQRAEFDPIERTDPALTT